MKTIAMIIVDGKEVEFDSLTAEQKEEIVDEMNRRALTVLGYRQVRKT